VKKLLSFGFVSALIGSTLVPSSSYAAFEPMLDESAMNQAIDPCVDFYTYSCGGWLAKTQIPADYPLWSRSFLTIRDQNEQILKGILEDYSQDNFSHPSTYQKKLGMFYGSCMDTDALKSATPKFLKTAFSEVEAIGKTRTLSQIVGKFHKEGIGLFFNIGSTQDKKDSSRMIAVVDQGGLGLPNRDYYLEKNEKKEKIRSQYVEHVAKMLELGAVASPAEAKKQAQTILEIETELAKNSLSPVDRRDPYKTYHPVGGQGLKELAPSFAWDDLFSQFGIHQTKDLNVAVPEFMSGLNQLVTHRPLEEIKLYVKWHILHGMAGAMDLRFVDENFRFYGLTLSGQKKQKPRWKTCVASTDSLLGEALGEAFVKKAFGEEGKKQTLHILQALQASFEKTLSSLDWMDKKTQEAALVKLKTIQNKMGYPDKWKDISKMDIKKTNYLENTLSAGRFWVEDDFKKVGKPTDRTEWYMTPPTVNAYYSAEGNEIVFPAGILQPPFFERNAGLAANYGAIGVVIGHELTHGFDDEGRKFDSKGNLNEWWTPKVAETFTHRAECLVNQFDKYKVAEGVSINGKLTLGENIADLGGLKLAYQAFQASRKDGESKHPSLSPEQQFFVSFGQAWCTQITPELEKLRAATDPHSPPQYRVNGSVQNLPEFAKAFGCAKSKPLNPSRTCSIW